MKASTKEELLKSHHNLIKSYSWKIAKSWKISFDDVLGEAYLLFCEAVETFDNKRGILFSTYLYSQLRKLTEGRMISGRYRPGPHGICRKWEEWRNITVDIDFAVIEDYELSFLRIVTFYELVKTNLSKDATILLNFILKTNKIWKKYELQNELRLIYKWVAVRTHKAFNEVKEFWRIFNSSAITI